MAAWTCETCVAFYQVNIAGCSKIDAVSKDFIESSLTSLIFTSN